MSAVPPIRPAARRRRSLVPYLVALLFGVSGTLVAAPVAHAVAATTIVLTINQRQALVNGDSVTVDTAPVLDTAAGRTFVPVRFIGETLGAYVGWNAGEQKVTYLVGETRINLWIGRKSAQVNGQTVPLDAAPYVDANARTLVPVRFVSEQMGASVGWDGPTQAITIAAPWVGRLVTIQNHAFTPATLEVAVGTRVTWVNLDDTTHDVSGSTLASPDLERGQAYAHTFSQAGVFDYGCTFHEEMSGTIQVR